MFGNQSSTCHDAVVKGEEEIVNVHVGAGSLELLDGAPSAFVVLKDVISSYGFCYLHSVDFHSSVED